MTSSPTSRSRRRAATGFGAAGAVGYALATSFAAHAALVLGVALSTPPVAPPLRLIDVEASFLMPAPADVPAAPAPASRVAAPSPSVDPAPPRRAARAETPARPLPAAAPLIPPLPVLEAAEPSAPPSPPSTAAASRGALPALPSAPALSMPRSTANVVYAEADVDQAPHLLGEARPVYPAAALRSGVEGDVVLSLVVDRTGSVTEARVTGPAGRGFDAAALAAVQHLRFRPGKRQGAPVAVSVTWTCRFRLEQ